MTTPRNFKRLLERDKRCLHCGETEAVAPNHRINRGMGGSKLRDHPANLVILCSWLNGAIESDPNWAAEAKRYGWKLNSWQDPLDEPVYDALAGKWFALDDGFSRKVIPGRKP